ncbi:MAG: putative glycoside hydrolase, partial [Oscillospiraceae bacterium]|nr:putative glycoside hydrolase [Oscillospiraceae bacterium]
ENSGLSVALDLFAPVLAYLVGQDIPELSKNVDFIKPMFYRITNAPAGIPFELKGYLDSFKAVNVDATGVLEKCWLQDNLCSDVAFERQLFLLYNKETRPGIEVNIVDGICDNTPEYVSQSINVLKRTGFSEPVLSWNLLNDVGSNLDVL